MSDEPNIYAHDTALHYLGDRVGELSEQFAAKEKDDKSYREKQIELLATLTTRVEELTDLKMSVRRLYVFCAVIACSTSAGAELVKQLFF